ncbi:uncharacterized protein [Euwallacea similis]|uniref:uncharacterized protein isoform X2 n=1 Tax=Euwallacea similis TaxID=1736056 RepID=UPI00344B4D34
MSDFSKHSNFAEESESSSDSDSGGASSDEHISGDALDDGPGTSRKTRDVYWCDVGEKSKPSQSQFPMVRRVVWPPPTTQPVPRNTYVDIRSLPEGNPKLGPKMQLYSKNGLFLAIYQDGQVRGTRDDSDQHTYLERKSGGILPEDVKFQGIVSQLYVAMDKRGRLYGERHDLFKTSKETLSGY